MYVYGNFMYIPKVMPEFKPILQTVSLAQISMEVLLCRFETLSEWRHKRCDPFWRIYWMDREGWHVRFNGRLLPLGPGHLTVIPPNSPFSTECRRIATQFYVHFTLDSLNNPYRPGVYSVPVTPKIRTFITGLKDRASTGPEQFLVRTLGIKQLCLDTLSRLPRESLIVSEYSPKVTLAMETMARNLGNPLSNEALARTAGMNTSSYIQLFHREAGCPPQKWYMEKRINQAALMLSHSEKTIEAIAEETGFFDRGHFSHMFKKVKGVSPAAYRYSRD